MDGGIADLLRSLGLRPTTWPGPGLLSRGWQGLMTALCGTGERTRSSGFCRGNSQSGETLVGNRLLVVASCLFFVLGGYTKRQEPDTPGNGGQVDI